MIPRRRDTWLVGAWLLASVAACSSSAPPATTALDRFCARYCDGQRAAIPVEGDDCVQIQSASECAAECEWLAGNGSPACRTARLEELGCASEHVWYCRTDATGTGYFQTAGDCVPEQNAVTLCEAAAEAGTDASDAAAVTDAADAADGG
jgi:hypothetical protein